MCESKSSLVLLFFLVIIVSWSSLVLAGEGVYGKPTWLESTGSKVQSVELGVMDKNSTFSSYQATFIVNGPNNQKDNAMKHVVLP